jgi:hypothetical protein
MVSMTNGRIGIAAAPSEDGSTIDDEVPRAEQTSAQGG